MKYSLWLYYTENKVSYVINAYILMLVHGFYTVVFNSMHK